MQLFLAFIVALSVTAALIPLLAKWAPTFGLTDAPGPRKVHAVPVPRVGGLAMAAGLFFASILMADLNPALRGLLLGLLVLVLFGLWDDRVTLEWRAKLLGQVTAVGICMAVGHIQVGTLSFGVLDIEPSITSTVITFFFLLGITNAINLADGLDGLAGGMALLCLCAIALFAMASGNTAVAAVALIEAGAVLGFLRFNTHPARVFMGDCGSQTLGLSVGALSLLATQGDTSVLSSALPLLLLGLPIVDTISVMLTRVRAGRSPFAADRNHLHHRLLAIGFTHREAVSIIYLLQVGLVLFAYFLRFERDSEIVLAFMVFASITLYLLYRASSTGWRLRRPEVIAGAMTQAINGPTHGAKLVNAGALAVMVTSLVAYAALIVYRSNQVSTDVGTICAGLALLLLVLTAWKAETSLHWLERSAAYFSVVLLVYLDQTIPHTPQLGPALSWLLIGTAGVAALVRYGLCPVWRFEVTTLDLIIIFIAVVVPNLPGSFLLPPDLPGGMAKAVILLYDVEMLLASRVRRSVPRTFLIGTLTLLAGRAFLG